MTTTTNLSKATQRKRKQHQQQQTSSNIMHSLEGSLRSMCLLKLVVSFSVLAAVGSMSPLSQQQQHRQHQEHNMIATTTMSESGNCCTARRELFVLGSSALFSLSSSWASYPSPALAKCMDIDTCREIGDKKVEQDLKDNPVVVLEESGVRYKQIIPGYGDKMVEPTSFVDLIYSISTGSGVYMYSQGFGYEKVNVGGSRSGLGGMQQQQKQSDAGLDSYRVTLGKGDLPVGIELALVGMKKGERRRIDLPPNVGFETSNWKPEPTTKTGKQHIKTYQTLLNGVGSTRPPFPAPTIWDVEVLTFR